MKLNKRLFSVLLLVLFLTVLILDTRTSLQGAQEGITLCLSVIVPSLFPFVFLAGMLPSRLLGIRIPAFRGMRRICGIPDGSESLLLLGFLGGYPLGASIITDAYRQGSISRATASRMLGFCSNAGPSFLFGMVAPLFPDRKIVWALWLIHILSALLVSVLLPGKSKESCVLIKNSPITVAQALETSLKTMTNICGWVVIFRVLLSVLDSWLLWLLPKESQAVIYGLLELSNGIIALQQLPNYAARFITCSGILAFGGLCVYMQTESVTMGLGTGLYFPGKVLQCLFSILLSLLIQLLLFPAEQRIHLPSAFYILVLVGVSIFSLFFVKKKSSSISGANIV